MIIDVLFYVFSAIMVISALMVISSKNPVHSVLFLILGFFNTAGIFILLEAEFLAMLIVIVYVGAVAVLFLFVVMMLNINFAQLRHGFLRYLPIGGLVAGIFLVELYVTFRYALQDGVAVIAHNPIADPATVTNTEALGNILYTEYIFPFQLSGIILLVAMIGAIVLTLRHKPNVRRQVIATQVSRAVEDCIEVVDVESGKGI